jgi:hypothetical protein
VSLIFYFTLEDRWMFHRASVSRLALKRRFPAARCQVWRAGVSPQRTPADLKASAFRTSKVDLDFSIADPTHSRPSPTHTPLRR